MQVIKHRADSGAAVKGPCSTRMDRESKSDGGRRRQFKGGERSNWRGGAEKKREKVSR